MNIVLLDITGRGFVDAARFVEEIEDDYYAKETIINLATFIDIINIQNDWSYDQGIDYCRQLQKRLVDPCMQGYGKGIIKHGRPGYEYEKAIEFCSYSKLTEEEKRRCFGELIIGLNSLYPKSKLLLVCDKIEEGYRFVCDSI